MEYSRYQKAIFDFAENDTRSCAIIAVAGSGKTTTGVELARRLPTDWACRFVAFNRNIAEELTRRLPSHVPAQTLNSLGYGALLRYLGTRGIKLDGRKTRGIISEKMAPDQQKLYAQGLVKLVGLAKAHGIVPRDYEGGTALTLDTEQNWADLLEKYDIEFESGANPLQGIKYARRVLMESILRAKQTIDFDDQLYLPVIWQARFPQHDALLVDEAQDVNMVQRAMIKMALKPGGRLFAFGDPRQSIYGFRGADTESIENIKREFAAIELPLSISYRCPKAVVQEARLYVSHIEPSESAPDGEVRRLGQYGPDVFQRGDAILCRNTAPLVGMAFALLKAGKGCKVLGRDIGVGLIRLIDLMKADTIAELQRKLESYRDREGAKLMAKGKEGQAAALDDKIDTIFIFIDRLEENVEITVADLCNSIAGLFSDDGGAPILLSTVHKAKGLEWDRVFILDSFLMPSKYARQDWQKVQEGNITYVAVTRAKDKLFYINSKQFEAERRGA